MQAEDLISRQIGDETVIIKDNGLSTYVLNRMAACIWELCDGTRGVDGITEKICERFEVDSDQANADVTETIDQLLKTGLVNQVKV
jgi:hypothetical protein